MGRGSETNRLDFGGDADQDPDPRFLDKRIQIFSLS